VRPVPPLANADPPTRSCLPRDVETMAAIPAGWTELESFDRLSVPVRMFKSDASGLRVCLLACEGPLVSGYSVLATEATTNEYAHRDDGLPHTLEHLVFLGSELYPFKGVLDKLANRCLAQGTNAWTDVDHTAYTITTAGSEGFLNLLPIYMDHVLFPTLTDEAFVTEIHHVTEEGDDKGVVYCEMQGRENTGESLVDRACLDQLYPDPLCGYNAETGGKMEQLRGCTNAAIQRYHQEYYRSDNCCLVVTGGVDATELLSALASTEAKVAEKKAAAATPPDAAPKLPRPWTRPVDSAWEGGRSELEFPSEDESTVRKTPFCAILYQKRSFTKTDLGQT
jgi:Zn-dependent M16 (insulinase) family peptidase